MNHNDDKSSSAKAGFIGAIVGAIAGVLAGVFALAPKGAKENRDDVKAKANEVKSDAQRKLSELQVELNDQVDQVKARVRGAKGKARTELNDLQKQLEVKVDEVKAALKDEEQEKDSVISASKELIAAVKKKLK